MNIRTVRQISACALVSMGFGLASSVQASSVTLDWNDSGWYTDSGNHSATNKNYIVRTNGNGNMRNYFVFDLSSVAGTITGATLKLTNPQTSAISTASYTLYDYAGAISSLETDTSNLGIYDDLGTGAVYGTQNNFRSSLSNLSLNSAALSALNSNHGLFALGGALTSTGESYFETYGNTGYAMNVRQLVLTVSDSPTAVPEPGTLALASLGLLGISALRRRKNA